MRFGISLLAAVALMIATATGASASDSIFWTNYNGSGSVSAANLDGSGGGRDLFVGPTSRGGTVNALAGLVLDPANGWIYWTNSNSKVTRGSIDGCDPSATCASDLYPLAVGGPPVGTPGGPAIDVAHGLMYWINIDGTLVKASLDGSGAVNTTLSTAGASAVSGGGGVGGLVIDPRSNRIYWTNDSFGTGDSISWANLDGSGGGDLNATGANVGRPWGLAIDTASNRVYWANYQGGDTNGGSISWANLDGTGGGNLYTAASPGCSMLNGANGVAIDRAANKIYWANFTGSTISSANLDGSGGCANLAVAGATLDGPDEVAILKAPLAQSAPAISKPTASTLSCSTVTWGADSPEAAFFRSPRTFAYRWSKAGSVVAGATASTFTPTASGSYSCAALATNAAGTAASQSSGAVTFKRPVRLSAAKFAGKTRRGKRVVSGKVAVSASPKVSSKDCKGSVAVKLKIKKKQVASKRFALKYKRNKCAAIVSLKVAKRYAGKKAKVSLSIGKSSTLTAKARTFSSRT